MSRVNSVSRGRSCRSKSNDGTQHTAKWAVALHSLTILFIIVTFVTLMVLLLNIWSAFPLSYSCDVIVYVLCISFHLSKSIFYFILIVRLQVAFGVSAYRYSRFQLNALFGFIIVYTIVLIVGTPYVVYGKWLTEPRLWCHVHIRDKPFVPVAVLSWIGLDIITSIVLAYLFQKPILKILAIKDFNGELTALLIKYSILTWLSISLCMLSLLLYLWKHITTLIELNLPFMCICVVAMHARYNEMFKRCCCLCTVCYSQLCGLKRRELTPASSVSAISRQSHRASAIQIVHRQQSLSRPTFTNGKSGDSADERKPSPLPRQITETGDGSTHFDTPHAPVTPLPETESTV